MRSNFEGAASAFSRRVVVSAVVFGSLTLVACGQASYNADDGSANLAGGDVSVASDTPSSSANFLVSRPGDRVAAFLGRSFPPSHWEETYGAAQDAVDGCIQRAGGRALPRPPVVFSAASELQGTNLPEFREKYGYGVVDSYRVEATRVPTPDLPPGDQNQVETDAQLAAECAGAADATMREVLPPIDLVRRYDAMLMDMADDPSYRDASKRWLDCMSNAGYSSNVVGPYFSKGVIEEIVFAAQRDGQRIDYELLQESELEVFRADSGCLVSSGAGEVMLILEQEILDTLRAEFPDYRPAANDPSGLAWADAKS